MHDWVHPVSMQYRELVQVLAPFLHRHCPSFHNFFNDKYNNQWFPCGQLFVDRLFGDMLDKRSARWLFAGSSEFRGRGTDKAGGSRPAVVQRKPERTARILSGFFRGCIAITAYCIENKNSDTGKEVCGSTCFCSQGGNAVDMKQLSRDVLCVAPCERRFTGHE